MVGVSLISLVCKCVFCINLWWKTCYIKENTKLKNQPIVQHNAVSHIPYCFSSIWYCQLFSFSIILLLQYHLCICLVSGWFCAFCYLLNCANVTYFHYFSWFICSWILFRLTVFQQDLMCKTFSHIHVSHRFLGIAYISTRLLRLTEKEKCEQHFLKISLSSSNSTSKLEQTWLTHCSQSLLPFPPLR